jgi:hypothetical protein
MHKEAVCGQSGGMGYSRRGSGPGRAFGGVCLWPGRRGSLGYWVGGFITLFLLGAGLAGVALGNFHTGGFALLFGIVCLVAGTRDLFHRRHGFGRIIN